MIFPESVEKIIAAIGYEATFKLVMKYRDCGRLYVPSQKQKDLFDVKTKHTLLKILTQAQFKSLCEHFGETTLEIPRLAPQMKEIRNNRILQQRKQGFTIPYLMQENNLSRSAIFKILKAYR